MSAMEEEQDVEIEEEEEEEEEETLVLVELHGVIDSEIITQDSFSKFKVLAVDSERPVLQVENFIFSGEYEHTLGTAVFFEEEEKRLKCDPVFCKKPPRMLRYACSTNKKLNMKRIFVSEKSAGLDVKCEGAPGPSNVSVDLSDTPQIVNAGDGDTEEVQEEVSTGC
ncbi:general transcription factor 3C polypeptide 6-like [Portunus trituberculatus]|uniref:general transcription factor 3C polypeptide 6-like n=1 Tax=Portunus trituberculatus TaxID=210409 RepID=UPI001E1CE0CA|nr:general transcription factor 3C polypeptide 6-like [Portunus trituberculatus]